MKQNAKTAARYALMALGAFLLLYWSVQLGCSLYAKIRGTGDFILWEGQLRLAEWAFYVNLTLIYFFARNRLYARN